MDAWKIYRELLKDVSSVLSAEALADPDFMAKVLKRKCRKFIRQYSDDVFHCQCCGGLNDQYMVSNKMWAQVNKGERFLCLDCVESRLGRFLTIEDFTPAKINNPIRQGYMMASEKSSK